MEKFCIIGYLWSTEYADHFADHFADGGIKWTNSWTKAAYLDRTNRWYQRLKTYHASPCLWIIVMLDPESLGAEAEVLNWWNLDYLLNSENAFLIETCSVEMLHQVTHHYLHLCYWWSIYERSISNRLLKTLYSFYCFIAGRNLDLSPQG